MKYLRLRREDRKALMDGLSGMADYMASRLGSVSPEERLRRGPEDTFSPVEQCWHLADLEREGFGLRIRRLLDEDDPLLPDFDGARVAEERDYRSRSMGEGLAAFRAQREANLALLRTVAAEHWTRAGTQEGVGRVALCDLPSMMAEHDAAHRAEIEAWSRARE